MKQKKIRVPEETLRVYIERDRPESFLVYVLPDVPRLQKFARDVMQNNDPNVALISGCCFSVDSTTDKDIVGILLLAQTELGAGYVAHEMGHAAFRAIERLGLKVDHCSHQEDAEPTARASSVEERYCGIVEHLNAGFWREAYRLGLAGGAASPSAVDALTREGLAGGGPPDGDVHAPPDAGGAARPAALRGGAPDDLGQAAQSRHPAGSRRRLRPSAGTAT